MADKEFKETWWSKFVEDFCYNWDLATEYFPPLFLSYIVLFPFLIVMDCFRVYYNQKRHAAYYAEWDRASPANGEWRDMKI